MSKSKMLPGGGPQGTILGLFLFLILINKAGFKNNARNLGEIVTTSLNKRKPMMTGHMKYVDDLSLLEAMDLKKVLISNTEPVRPLNYHERTNHILTNQMTKTQVQIDELKQYTIDNEMKINRSKSKVMIFNQARTRDFEPEIRIDGASLDVVDEMRLLGGDNH